MTNSLQKIAFEPDLVFSYDIICKLMDIDIWSLVGIEIGLAVFLRRGLERDIHDHHLSVIT